MNISTAVSTLIAVTWLTAPAGRHRDCNDDWAEKYNGQIVNVCSRMVGGVHLSRIHRQPTLLYFERAFENHIFAAVIYGENREKFGEPEQTFLNKMTCVKGVLKVSGDRAEIVVTEPSQLIEDKGN